ncbi:energy transducer TonB [bacterium]|nr:MAG: energy transducer TonB [candidate division KSB1 bacterium]MCE7944224.1 energy transducer TonB [Chlorobi bacterium CHB1]MCL4706988.1 energy transducer TonB [bacterium]MDL1875478.1 energy transducer TonB [Cytophagia bacterium CHB2]MBC6948353.1 energy transducer TonB [candidate division KSB1 bacterium]
MAALSEVAILEQLFPYGAPELVKNYKKYATTGLIIAALLHAGALGAYYVIPLLFPEEEEPMVTVRIMKYSELGPPPSLTNQSAAAPAISVSAPAVRPSVGIPIPVPDAEVSPEQTFASQEELAQAVGPIGEGTGTGGEVVFEQDIQIEEDGPPPDFVPFEKEPVAIKKPSPTYPEIARKAGLEGTVWLKVWVDKEGKVRKAVVQKSDAEIFNQPAIDAATQWVFTPALQQNGPVAVWISIPFRFKLSGK